MIKIIKYRILDKGALKGKIDLEIDTWADFQIIGISIFESGDRRWISFPAQKGEKKDANGKDVWYAHCKFREPKTMKAFEEKTLAALEAWLKAGNVPENSAALQSHTYVKDEAETSHDKLYQNQTVPF